MISVGTTPGIGGERMKENDEEDEFMCHIFDIFKNFCKCYKVYPPSTKVQKRIYVDTSLSLNQFVSLVFIYILAAIFFTLSLKMAK
jgi:hypothetical protein